MTIMQKIGDGVLSANQSTISLLTPALGPGEQLNIYASVTNDHAYYVYYAYYAFVYALKL